MCDVVSYFIVATNLWDDILSRQCGSFLSTQPLAQSASTHGAYGVSWDQIHLSQINDAWNAITENNNNTHISNMLLPIFVLAQHKSLEVLFWYADLQKNLFVSHKFMCTFITHGCKLLLLSFKLFQYLFIFCCCCCCAIIFLVTKWATLLLKWT